MRKGAAANAAHRHTFFSINGDGATPLFCWHVHERDVEKLGMTHANQDLNGGADLPWVTQLI